MLSLARQSSGENLDSVSPVGVIGREVSLQRTVPDRRAGAGGRSRFFPLALGATGVVFGDISTSPLYTYNSIFSELGDNLPDEADVVGAFGVIFWTLVWITCFKYIGVVMRISHHGEGGSMALMQVVLEALSRRNSSDNHQASPESDDYSDTSSDDQESTSWSCQQWLVVALATLSCSMLIGDGVITPPNSVLGALNSPVLTVPVDWNVAIAVAILVGTFALQRVGSRIIGLVAGPIMILWLLAIGALGIYHIAKQPDIAWAMVGGFNPKVLVRWFFTGNFQGILAFKALAGVVLCVTGSEALYADMGHFGAGPITFAWFFLVFPCLVLQYMAQGICIIQNPSLVTGNPLYNTCPEALVWPLFILAALAAVIASQALISGVFSILTQAHALGFIPRILVLHTNPDEKGQVYIPEANWALMILCVLVTVTFRTSDRLVAAYGIAVSGAFIFTTSMLWWVLRNVWNWWLLPSILLISSMLLIDLVFWIANLVKILDSGWVPMVIALLAFSAMQLHRWGRTQELQAYNRGGKTASVPALIGALQQTDRVARSDAFAVFLTPKKHRVPLSVDTLTRSLGGLPRTILMLNVEFEDQAFVPEEDQMSFEALDEGLGLYSVTMFVGYAEPLTAARFNLHSNLVKLAKEKLPSFPALQKLASAQEEPSSGLLNVGLAGLELGEVPSLPESQVAYVLTKKHFTTADSDGMLKPIMVQLYSSLVNYGRSPMTFFGLEANQTLEVSAVLRL